MTEVALSRKPPRRRMEAVAVVRDNPGIDTPSIAEKLGIRPNYLYKALPDAAEEGLIRKEGRGWFPVTNGNDPAVDVVDTIVSIVESVGEGELAEVAELGELASELSSELINRADAAITAVDEAYRVASQTVDEYREHVAIVTARCDALVLERDRLAAWLLELQSGARERGDG